MCDRQNALCLPPPSRAAPYLWGLLLVVATLVVYIPAMRSGYVWDDDAHILGNRTLRNVEGLRTIWLAFRSNEFYYPITTQYYPLAYSSFWLEYHLWGLNPIGYHIVNVCMHALSALLLWRILARLSVPGAWFAAAIFALHPVHVESVAWITERKNTLSGAFYLGAMLAYLRFIPLGYATGSSGEGATPDRRWGWYALAIFLFLCALLCKTVTASLPAALLLILWWKRDWIRVRDLLPLVPMLALGIALGLNTAFMERHRTGAMGEDWTLSLLERGLLAGRILWFYASKLVWPNPIIFIYPRWTVNSSVWWQALFSPAFAAVVAVLWLLRRRIGKGPLVAVLLFSCTLTPALGFFDVYPMRFSYVADHFQYLASIGVIALIAAGGAVLAGQIPRGRRAVSLVSGGGVLVALGAMTWSHEARFADAEKLWRDTIRENPQAWIAHLNLGIIQRRQGKLDDALASFQEVLDLKKHYPEAHNLIGATLIDQGRIREAIPHLQTAIRAWPGYEEAYNYLGQAYLDLGRVDESIQQQEIALRLKPSFAKAHQDLASALLAKNDVDGAVRHLRESLRLDPYDPRALGNYGTVLARLGRYDEAIVYFKRAIAVHPGYAPAYANLGSAYARQGKIDQAIRAFSEAVRLDPRSPQMLNTLARLMVAHVGPNPPDPNLAIQYGEEACRLTGYRVPYTLDTLAAAYAMAGRFDRAVETARRALKLVSSPSQKPLADAIRRRLQLYEQGKPYRGMI